MMAELTKPRDDKGRLIKTKGGKVSYWERWTDNGGELWMTAEEMVDNGVVDEIWTKE